jgi:hypothetical protein
LDSTFVQEKSQCGGNSIWVLTKLFGQIALADDDLPSWVRGVPLDMGRIHPECPDSDSSDHSAPSDILLREEPDEEDDEEQDEGNGEEDDDDIAADGYSE